MTTSACRTYSSTVAQLVHYIYAQLKDYGTIYFCRLSLLPDEAIYQIPINSVYGAKI